MEFPFGTFFPPLCRVTRVGSLCAIPPQTTAFPSIEKGVRHIAGFYLIYLLLREKKVCDPSIPPPVLRNAPRLSQA